MKLRVMIIAAMAAALGGGGAAYAQLAPKEAVSARINNYRETGAALKSINDALKTKTAVKFMMRSSARTIANTARDQHKWFPAGSGPESGLKTKAKANIWSDAAGFSAAQAKFQREADLMVKVVETGDTAQMQKQAKALGQTCSACHNKYRVED